MVQEDNPVVFAIRGMVIVLAVVGVICLGAIGLLARAAATDAVALFNFTAWIIPVVGVGAILSIAAGGTYVGLKKSEKASEVEHREEAAESEQGTNLPEERVVFANEAGLTVVRIVDEGGDIREKIYDRGALVYTHMVSSPAAADIRDAHGNVLDPATMIPQGVQRSAGQGAGQVASQVQDVVGGVTDQAGEATFQEWQQAKMRAAEAIMSTIMSMEVTQEDLDRAVRRFYDEARREARRDTQQDPQRVPIEEYDALSVADVVERLNGLSTDDLQRVRDYEKQNNNRSALLEQIDRRINAASS